MKHWKRQTVERSMQWNLDDEDQTEVTIEYSATPGTPGSGQFYYGPIESYDTGSPDEFDILSVKTLSGEDITLTAEEDKAALTFVENFHEWDDGPDPDDYYDQTRENRMMGMSR